MGLVVDANVIISGLLSDSTSRELLVTLKANLLSPEAVKDEIDSYENMLVRRSDLKPVRLHRLKDAIYREIEFIPTQEFYQYMGHAEDAIGDIDPDDKIYVACALAKDAEIWSDDGHFDEQEMVDHYDTPDIVDEFETLR